MKVKKLSMFGKIVLAIRYKLLWLRIVRIGKIREKERKLLLEEFLSNGGKISEKESEIAKIMGINENDYLAHKLQNMKYYPKKWHDKGEV